MPQTRALAPLGSQLWSWGPGVQVPWPTPLKRKSGARTGYHGPGSFMSLPRWHQVPCRYGPARVAWLEGPWSAATAVGRVGTAHRQRWDTDGDLRHRADRRALRYEAEP